jgi:hypothetical protein
MIGRRVWTILILCLSSVLSSAAEEIPFRVAGGYLAYSYDHGRVYGEKVRFKLGEFDIAGRYFKADLPARAYAAAGGVTVARGEDRRDADEILFDPGTLDAILITFGEAIVIEPLDPAHPPSEGTRQKLLSQESILQSVTPVEIQASLLYAAAAALEVTAQGEVTGFDVMIYVEGLESVGFAKLKLASGEKSAAGGLSLDKIWYTKTQGVFGKVSYTTPPSSKIKNATQAYYEEHSILKDYAGLPRQLDLQTTTSWSPNERSTLGLGGNYNSTNLWNARAWFDRKWNEGRNSLALDVSYNKPLQRNGETWFGLRSTLDFGGWGRLAVQGGYEVHDQTLTNLSYTASALQNKLRLQLVSSYSRVQAGGAAAEIFTGTVAVSYDARLFNLATDYYLNYDLAGNQRLNRPQLRLSVKPVTLYGGLLTMTVQNIFILNSLRSSGFSTQSYNNNTSLALTAAPIFVLPDLSFQASLAAEQFLEKEGRNFTSGGLVLRAEKRFGEAVSLEGFYSAQSRRRTRSWLIEGTTSQDLSAVVRLNPAGRINGWVSFSFDPKVGEWKQSFSELTVGLIRNWRFQSLLSYDFYWGKVSNIDLYLIRKAGRFDLRFIWRSSAKQFFVELVPTR